MVSKLLRREKIITDEIADSHVLRYFSMLDGDDDDTILFTEKDHNVGITQLFSIHHIRKNVD